MKCVVPGANVKILAKAIHALAKIGDEMYIEPKQNAISFRTVNMANSAYADFTFRQSYFSYYIYGDLQENDAVKCKISMRSAMTVFKAPNLIDKQVETCHIRLEADASEILFILKYKNSITKTHLLPILDCEILQTVYDKDCAPIKLSSQPRVLADAVQNFHQHLIEITLEVTTQKLLLRNYIDDATGLSNTTRTQLALGKGEFDRYEIGNETSITFCMKEFKSILNFSETVGIPMNIYFEGAGRPVIFVLKNPSFEANLILSTLSPDADSQTDTTLNSRQEKSLKKTAKKRGPRKATNKSTSRIQNWSMKCSKTLRDAAVNKSNLTEEEKQKKQDSSKQQVNLSVNASSSASKDVNEANNLSTERNVQKEPQKCYTPSCEISKKSNKTSTSGRELVNSIFSTITKRKSSNDEVERQKDNDEFSVLEDRVPSSPPPPSKRARFIFQKCFQKTFDPGTLPGYDIILAEDSDEYCSE